MGQLFSLMPIAGYTGADPSTVTMRYRSVRFLYACLTLFLMLSLIVMLMVHTGHEESIGVQRACKYKSGTLKKPTPS